MSKVTKDNNFIMIEVPNRDIESMVRSIAHSFCLAQVEDKNPVADLMNQIVFGDLATHDEYVSKVASLLNLDKWVLVYSVPEALELCDDLADRVYEEIPVAVVDKHLRIVKVCVECQKGYVKGLPHDCVVK